MKKLTVSLRELWDSGISPRCLENLLDSGINIKSTNERLPLKDVVKNIDLIEGIPFCLQSLPKYNKQWDLLACNCASIVKHLFYSDNFLKAIEVFRDHLNNVENNYKSKIDTYDNVCKIRKVIDEEASHKRTVIVKQFDNEIEALRDFLKKEKLKNKSELRESIPEETLHKEYIDASSVFARNCVMSLLSTDKYSIKLYYLFLGIFKSIQQFIATTLMENPKIKLVPNEMICYRRTNVGIEKRIRDLVIDCIDKIENGQTYE